MIPGGTSPFVIDLASRMKNIRPVRSPRSSVDASSSEIYIFPAPARSALPDASRRWYRKSFAGLPRWIRALTMRRVLILGAAACYALILFNLIYGIASLARLQPGRPIPLVNALELQRAKATPPANGLPVNWAASTVAVAVAGRLDPGFCRTEDMREAPRPAPGTRRVAVRKPGEISRRGPGT